MHLKPIDWLRGVAALWVLLYHLWNRIFPGLTTQFHALSPPSDGSIGYWLTLPTIQFGYIGVTLFFVLSGFCIHWPQAKRLSVYGADSLSLKEFALRRFWRLYPGYFASIVFAALAVGLYPTLLAVMKGSALDVGSVFHIRHAVMSAFFLQLYEPTALEFNGVYWTLLYEVQFYLLYPVLLWATRRYGLVLVTVVLLSLELASALYPPSFPNLFFTKYFEWYLGFVAAEWIANGRHPVSPKPLAVLGLTIGALCVCSVTTHCMRDLFIAIGFFGLLLMLLDSVQTSWIFRSRYFRPFDAFLTKSGQISYGLYLIHVSVIDIVWNGGSLLRKYGYLGEGAFSLFVLLSVPAAFLLATQFYTYIEEPFMRKGKRAAVAAG